MEEKNQLAVRKAQEVAQKLQEDEEMKEGPLHGLASDTNSVATTEVDQSLIPQYPGR